MIHGTQEAMRRMRPRGTGHIVNIASLAGKAGYPNLATYAATKHAVVGLSEAVRFELKGSGVEVSCVMPGIVNTELSSGMTGGARRQEPHAASRSPARSSARSRSRASTCSSRARPGRC